MVRQLALLTTAAVAILGQTHVHVSTCGALLSPDGKCQNDNAALLQVAITPEETLAKTSNDDSGGPFGPARPKHQDMVMTSMNDWHSSRDLARVWGVQNVAISPKWTVQIFSAVPVFGKDETYIALLLEHYGDVPFHEPEGWAQDLATFVMFCAGPDGSHKTQVIARGHSWLCPWPREEWESKQFKVLLEDQHGTNLGMVLAEHDPKLLGQYKMMACVRDIFYIDYDPDPNRRQAFSGPFKQWVEWMEWSSMHGLEHFLLYTFEGTDLAAVDVMKPYLDIGIASRVHFQFYHGNEEARQEHLMSDCIHRAKNHAKWLTTSVDVDEYMVFPGKVKYFNWDDILKEQGVLEDKVASLELSRIRFARARPESLEISSDQREPACDPWPKQVIMVDKVYESNPHWLTNFKAGTETIKVDRKFAVLQHYRIPSRTVTYDKFDFNDPTASVKDEILHPDLSLLEEAVSKRFNVTDVKSFLTKLAQRRPANADDIAAAHPEVPGQYDRRKDHAINPY